jgi:hypothetical protein
LAGDFFVLELEAFMALAGFFFVLAFLPAVFVVLVMSRNGAGVAKCKEQL